MYQLSIATQASAIISHKGTIPPMKDTLCQFEAFINPTSQVYISHRSNTNRVALAWVRCPAWCTSWPEWRRCKLTEVQDQGRAFPITLDILQKLKHTATPTTHWDHSPYIYIIHVYLWKGSQLHQSYSVGGVAISPKKTFHHCSDDWENLLQRVIPRLLPWRMSTIVQKV